MVVQILVHSKIFAISQSVLENFKSPDFLSEYSF